MFGKPRAVSDFPTEWVWRDGLQWLCLAPSKRMKDSFLPTEEIPPATPGGSHFLYILSPGFPACVGER